MNNSLSGSFLSKGKHNVDDTRPFSPLQERRRYIWGNRGNLMHGGRPKNAYKHSRCNSKEPEDMVDIEAPPLTGIRVKTELIISRSDRLAYNNRLF